MSQMFHCIQHHKSDLRAYKCVTVQSALTAVLGSSDFTAMTDRFLNDEMILDFFC